MVHAAGVRQVATPAKAVAGPGSRTGDVATIVDHSEHGQRQSVLIQLMKHGPAAVAAREQHRALFGDMQRQSESVNTNRTGLPDTLKSGIESLSGVSLDDVRVHYNSGKPAQLQAHAYAQGTDIHVASGQEEHLPHEAWHIVQQAQDRVGAPRQLMAATRINDDPALEREADAMGRKALAAAAEHRAAPAPRPAPKPAATPAPTAIAQLVLKINGKKAQSFNTLDKLLQSDFYGSVVAPLEKKFGVEKVHYHLGQMITIDHDFENEEHFRQALLYDITTKSIEGEPLTLQQHWMTELGWTRRANAEPPSTAKDKGRGQREEKSKPAQKGPTLSSAKKESWGKSEDYGEAAPETLKLYRTMVKREWVQLEKGGHEVLQGGHVGDFKQAHQYLFRKSSEPKVLIEFELKPGYERRLFGGKVLALPKPPPESKKKMDLSVPTKIRQALKNEGSGESFALASTNEGLSDGRIGVKSESHGEAGFSFGIGGGTSSELFMGLVGAMRVVGESDGQTGSAAAVGGKESDQDRDGAKQGEKVKPEPIYDRVKGYEFDPVDPRIRHDGKCLWDVLQVCHGYSVVDLQTAAKATGQAYGYHVDDTHVWGLLTALGAPGLHLIVWAYGKEDDATVTVKGDGSIVIGLIYAADGLGHYLPPRG